MGGAYHTERSFAAVTIGPARRPHVGPKSVRSLKTLPSTRCDGAGGSLLGPIVVVRPTPRGVGVRSFASAFRRIRVLLQAFPVAAGVRPTVGWLDVATGICKVFRKARDIVAVFPAWAYR